MNSKNDKPGTRTQYYRIKTTSASKKAGPRRRPYNERVDPLLLYKQSPVIANLNPDNEIKHPRDNIRWQFLRRVFSLIYCPRGDEHPPFRAEEGRERGLYKLMYAIVTHLEDYSAIQISHLEEYVKGREGVDKFKDVMDLDDQIYLLKEDGGSQERIAALESERGKKWDEFLDYIPLVKIRGNKKRDIPPWI